MKILVIGVSSQTSVGYLLAQHLKDHEFIFASRSGKLGEACDVTNNEAVAALIFRIKPDVVIHAAGFYREETLGNIQDWQAASSNVLAKAFGALVVLNEAVKNAVPIVIFFGGKMEHADPLFAPFVVGNGAMLVAVRFAAEHSSVQAYYLEMGLIIGSSMGKLIQGRGQGVHDEEVHIETLAQVVQGIISGSYANGSQIVLY